jgi:hypothetical protein
VLSLKEQIRLMVDTSNAIGAQADGLAKALRGFAAARPLGRTGAGAHPYCHGQQRVPLALHGLDLLEKQLSSRSGGLESSQRNAAWALVTVAAIGWLTSWAIEAVSCPLTPSSRRQMG